MIDAPTPAGLRSRVVLAVMISLLVSVVLPVCEDTLLDILRIPSRERSAVRRMQTLRIVIHRAGRRSPMIAALAPFWPFYADCILICGQAAWETHDVSQDSPDDTRSEEHTSELQSR